jgi:hypothetical protein
MPVRPFEVDVLDLPHTRLVRVRLPAKRSPQYAEAEEVVRQALADALWQGYTRAVVDGVGVAGRVRVPAHRGWQDIGTMLDGIDRYGGAFTWLAEHAAMTYSGSSPGALREVHVQVNRETLT